VTTTFARLLPNKSNFLKIISRYIKNTELQCGIRSPNEQRKTEDYSRQSRFWVCFITF